MKDKKRVFLSYNYTDKNIVERISSELLKRNINVVNDYNNIKPGDRFVDKLRYLIESSDIVIFLLSKNYFKSKFSIYELSQFLSEAQKRKITIIPTIIENCKIPNELKEFDTINFTRDFESGIKKLVDRLEILPKISFDSFDSFDFENFVFDLLKEYGFKNIVKQFQDRNAIFDFKAEHIYKNPLGMVNKDTWLIEVKFYKKERFSINSIRQLVEFKRQLLPSDLKLLLITNSILTSVAEEYLNNIQKIENTQIEVIDGQKLKQLVSKRKKLINKYFLI